MLGIMGFDLSRRTSFWAIALIFGTAVRAIGEPLPSQPAVERIAAIERGLGGRVAVGAIDTVSGQRAECRGTERFPMCSTFKFLAASAVLQRGGKKEEQLDLRVSYSAVDLSCSISRGRTQARRSGHSYLVGAALRPKNNPCCPANEQKPAKAADPSIR